MLSSLYITYVIIFFIAALFEFKPIKDKLFGHYRKLTLLDNTIYSQLSKINLLLTNSTTKTYINYIYLNNSTFEVGFKGDISNITDMNSYKKESINHTLMIPLLLRSTHNEITKITELNAGKGISRIKLKKLKIALNKNTYKLSDKYETIFIKPNSENYILTNIDIDTIKSNIDKKNIDFTIELSKIKSNILKSNIKTVNKIKKYIKSNRSLSLELKNQIIDIFGNKDNIIYTQEFLLDLISGLENLNQNNLISKDLTFFKNLYKDLLKLDYSHVLYNENDSYSLKNFIIDNQKISHDFIEIQNDTLIPDPLLSYYLQTEKAKNINYRQNNLSYFNNISNQTFHIPLNNKGELLINHYIFNNSNNPALQTLENRFFLNEYNYYINLLVIFISFTVILLIIKINLLKSLILFLLFITIYIFSLNFTCLRLKIFINIPWVIFFSIIFFTIQLLINYLNKCKKN